MGGLNVCKTSLKTKMGEGGFEPPATRPPAEYHTKLDHPPLLGKGFKK